MKRHLFYFATVLVGLVGFFLILCGVLFLPSASGVARNNCWRIVSVGMIMVGFFSLLNIRRIPDHVPGWVKRYFAPIYTLFWFITGGIIFILSWF
jgi:hypothetical protein